MSYVLTMNMKMVNEKTIDTRRIVYEALREIGCAFSLPMNPKDRSIHFVYCDSKFSIVAEPDMLFITIWRMGWYTIPIDGSLPIELLADIVKAVNHANIEGYVTSMLGLDDDETKLGIHSKMFVPIFDELPDYDYAQYLKSQFDGFLESERVFTQYLHNLMNERIQSTSSI